ncbi:hypothetical protein BREVUG8_70211 [Brevundimonas sp. G8]|nr:hypothetical protein BREVUG8_70211 [Brevundimonas sp. G8]
MAKSTISAVGVSVKPLLCADMDPLPDAPIHPSSNRHTHRSPPLGGGGVLSGSLAMLPPTTLRRR